MNDEARDDKTFLRNAPEKLIFILPQLLMNFSFASLISCHEKVSRAKVSRCKKVLKYKKLHVQQREKAKKSN